MVISYIIWDDIWKKVKSVRELITKLGGKYILHLCIPVKRKDDDSSEPSKAHRSRLDSVSDLTANKRPRSGTRGSNSNVKKEIKNEVKKEKNQEVKQEVKQDQEQMEDLGEESEDLPSVEDLANVMILPTYLLRRDHYVKTSCHNRE